MLDADDIHLNCNLKVKSRIESCLSVSRLCECHAGAYEYGVSELPSSSRITVYYPDASDSLFSVAKRFHTTPEKLARDNMITDAASLIGEHDSLCDVKKLIIR